MLWPICSMGVAHVKYQICWVSLNPHALGFIGSVFLMWSLEEEGRRHLRSITSAQQGACVRAITIGGLDNVVEARYA